MLTARPSHHRRAAGLCTLLTMGTGCPEPCHPSITVEAEYEAAGTEVALHGVVNLAARGELLVVGDAGTIRRRSAQGVWSGQDSGITSALYAVASRTTVEKNVAVAVGAMGATLHTHDGGGHWTSTVSGVEADLYDLTYDGDYGARAVAVGDGVILVSDDDGMSWTPAALPNDIGVLRAVATRSESGSVHFLSVGDGGLALLSTDAGATWTRVDTGTSNDLRAVGVAYSVLGEQAFVIAGDGGVALSMKAVPGPEWYLPGPFTRESIVDIAPGGDWVLTTDSSILYGYPASQPLREGLDKDKLVSISGDFGEMWAVGAAGTVLHLTRDQVYCIAYY